MQTHIDVMKSVVEQLDSKIEFNCNLIILVENLLSTLKEPFDEDSLRRRKFVLSSERSELLLKRATVVQLIAIKTYEGFYS